MDSDQLDLKAILATMSRQKRPILLTMVLLLGLAFAYLILAKPIYQSTVLLQVDGRSSNLLDPSASGSEQSSVLNSRVDSEVEILRSQATALAVVYAADLIRDPEFGPQLGWISKLGLALGTDFDANSLRRLVGLEQTSTDSQESLVNGTLKSLQSAVNIRRSGLTFLIGISVSSETPKRAADIANIYAQSYIERQVMAKTQATISARDVLRRQVATAEADLAASERAVNTFIETNLSRLEKESGDPAIAELRRRLNSAMDTQTSASAQVLSAEAAISSQDWASVASTLGDQAIAELARQRKAIENRLGSVAAGSTEAIDMAAEMARLDADLARTSSATLTTVRADMGAMRDRERETRDQLRTQLLQSDLSSEMLAELFNLQQSATVARNQYQTLLAREQDLGALANLQIADARVVSEALPANSASSPNRKLIIALALVGGLGLGVLLAFLKEYFFGGIVSSSQLENIMQARVPVTLAMHAAGKTGPDPAETVVASPMSAYAESFRKLRAVIDIGLLNSRKETTPVKRGRIIVVSSAIQAEGKTTTAISLARTYALSGTSTLLIDGDLRRPTVAPRLGDTTAGGLIDFLAPRTAGDTSPIVTFNDPQTSLTVIGAGARSGIPTDQLLNGASFQGLMEAVVASFDVIIIDSPPLLPVVDTRYLARFADAVVHVVRYGSTMQGEVREAAAQMREFLKADALYIGVLNMEERETRRYGYYGEYGHYGKDSD
ncbi:GumC family protein [Pseudorhodobacter sp. W20_MBD10_FR17]|uniref:GumC family protein n=1 Tax=Pseudorhodobacter sp. W20_MBD10_FR17 TaxID=3240266 RepID=UPI003F974F3B